MDNFSAHKTPEVAALLNEKNITALFLPSNMTSVLQPLDVGCNKPFKDYCRQDWVEKTWPFVVTI
ncbi:hypothetical protein O9G_005323 [Rozella allomycis CSF55]|uniref:DDE-1 domain-containing protein n=1 Tax=Rozella allomycis (strain CSF55) TaxID=988480 RepID=A0A075AUA2_ROZAC|nr:hypothetical protein O9G_005323 [Rozella allomycis CSF55]|eukprot:EPZ32072.1 hypothetical protein O9G_005323 [Rozella allomycis CSF55]